MKKLMIGLTVLCAVAVGVAHAGNIEVVDPELDLIDNTVIMKARMTGNFPQPTVKIMFAGNSSGLDENATIQPYNDWYYATNLQKTTIANMYAEGWKILQIIPYNSNAAKQFYIVFSK